MHVNTRSVLPKFVFFPAIAHSANPDVLAVSEAWLRKATKNSEISIPNYIFRQDRTAKGGGVSVQSSVIAIQVYAQTVQASTFNNPPFQK